MRKIIFSSTFLSMLFFNGAAQDLKPRIEHWRKLVPEEKFPKIDTTVHFNSDSVSKILQYPSVEIPNVYNKKFSSRMPVLILSGKGLAPMPGTEELDKRGEVYEQQNKMKVLPPKKEEDKK